MKLLVLVAAALAFGGGLVFGTRGHDTSRADAPAAQLDLDQTQGREAAFLSRFDVQSMVRSAGTDAIRAIDHPVFEQPEEARLLPPTGLVVGLELGGESHAYPIDLLSLHEVVNDVVGDLPVAITWCPLCSTALGFDRRVDGRTLTFGVSGFLFRANQVLFDRETGSLWSQLLGGSVTGTMRGTELRRVPLALTTWQEWLADHPATVVLSISRDPLARRFTEPSSSRTIFGVRDSDTPYGDYTSKVDATFPRTVRGVRDGTRVIGIVAGKEAKAYPLDVLGRRRTIQDAVGGRPILLTYDGPALSGAVFSRVVRGRALDFRLEGGRLVDRQTGTRWSPRTGRALAGPLAGEELLRLSATTAYWFAWRGYYPETLVAR